MKSTRWTLAILVMHVAPTLAQPTYKLGVPPHLQPQATLTRDGLKISRSEVKNDPGFRLQFHFQKDGKTIAAVDARAQGVLEIPKKEPGVYTVVLELFHPVFKPGKDHKDHFKPISN